ncbi:MAG: ABC transporter permease [Actinobacteria bacterium]|nr:ABC transporter permease [Actinomycetota bacterium]MBL7123377.1 ABC transporter permease [Actinomycetota bacterium]
MIKNYFKRNKDTVFLVGMLIIISGLFSIINPEQFSSFYSFQSLLFQIPELGLLTLAMMIPIISGGINLSIISTANIVGVITAIFFRSFNFESLFNYQAIIIFSIGILLALTLSIIFGLLNGLLVGYLNINPVLATLGTMIFYSGVSLLISEGKSLKGFPSQMFYIGNGVFVGIPISFIILIFCCGFIYFILKKTAFGISIYMIGLNPLATKFSGLNNKVILLKTYLISGLLSGIAALIMMSRFNSAKSDYGESYLLVTILIVVLGGVSISGGSGSVINVFIAVLVLSIISMGFNFFAVNAFLTQTVWGLLLLIVILIRRLSTVKNTR